MIWVAWRQFRTQAIVTLGLLAVFAAVVIALGLHLRDVYSFCIQHNSCSAPIGGNKLAADLLGPALLAIPALLGMFLGAPLVARELESGTFRLAWTQSVTRRRWLSVRVALVGVAVLAVAGLASWLVSWGLAPIVAINMNHFDPSMFTARGIVPIGYTAFAFALGVAAGTLTRRTLPAMVVTLIGFITARIAITLWIRPHLLQARHAVFTLGAGKGIGYVSSAAGVSLAPQVPPIPNAWMVSETLVNRAHHALSTTQLHDLLVRTCPKITTFPPFSAKANDVAATCQQQLSHHLTQLVAYQPPSHYWPLQFIETAIYFAAGIILIGVLLWRIGPSSRARRASDAPPARTPDPLQAIAA